MAITKDHCFVEMAFAGDHRSQEEWPVTVSCGVLSHSVVLDVKIDCGFREEHMPRKHGSCGGSYKGNSINQPVLMKQ